MSTSEKLKGNEKSLFRRVYLARIEAGASVEAAERQALHAVKRWDALGALNDDRPDLRDAEIARLREGIEAVRALLWDDELDLNLYDEVLYDWLNELVAGTVSQPLNAKMLRERLHKSNPSSKSNAPAQIERADAEAESSAVELIDASIGPVGVTALRALGLWFESSDREPKFSGVPMSNLILNIVQGTMSVEKFANLLHFH